MLRIVRKTTFAFGLCFFYYRELYSSLGRTSEGRKEGRKEGRNERISKVSGVTVGWERREDTYSSLFPLYIIHINIL